MQCPATILSIMCLLKWLNLQSKLGKDEAVSLSKKASLSAEKLFKSDDDLDGPGVPTVEEFLKSSGLQEFF